MSGTDVEHRTEIRRANQTAPIWIGLILVAAIVIALVVRSPGGGTIEEEGVTPPPTSTTTPSRSVPAVFGVTDSGGEVRPISVDVRSEPTPGGRDDIRLGPSAPIVTAGRVLVLDEDGGLQVGAPGQSFNTLACCFDDIHPSNEPNHVWLRIGDLVQLLDLDAPGSGRTVLLVVGDETVLGPASFGLVTRDDRDVVRWHRPSFDPTVLGVPPGGRAIDAGGERLLVAVPADAGRGARLEVWSITGNGRLSSHVLHQDAAPEGRLAPDGSVVLVPAPGGWEVRDAVTGRAWGTLPKVSDPVWVGGNRFAASLDGRLVVSDSGELPIRWPVLAVAEQSP